MTVNAMPPADTMPTTTADPTADAMPSIEAPRLRSDGAEPQWSRREAILSGFILFHIVAITVWCFGVRPVVQTRAGRGLGRYMVFSGLYQGWDMFAPKPMSLNTYLQAEITYRSGRTRLWRFPRPQDAGYVQRMFLERQRKWASERLRVDENAALWPDAARYVARLNGDPNDPPASVTLIRYWSEIAPPKSGKPEPWQHDSFFTYAVTPADLR
jgi:hypothetical protein